MAKAVNLVTDVPYQCEADTDEVKTTWMLRSLTGGEMMDITKQGFVDHNLILELGIVGWKDFYDHTGEKEIEFSKANIQLIPGLLFQELSFKIQELVKHLGYPWRTLAQLGLKILRLIVDTYLTRQIMQVVMP